MALARYLPPPGYCYTAHGLLPTAHRSPGQVSTIDDDRRSRDVTAGVAGQKQGRPNQFPRLAPATHGGTLGKGFLLGVRQEGCGKFRKEWAGRDAIDGDSKGAQVERAAAGQAEQASLRDRIEITLFFRYESHDRR